jgi:NAD(P)-dependent dehydrogenase (short-subunit alcohol dehydrogenase family)
MGSSTPAATRHTAGTTGRQLEGKTALVNGGGSGIGLAAAQRLAAEGAHVFLTGRNQETVDRAAATIGPDATGIRADVSNVEDLTIVADAIAARGQGLDVIFANAGGGEFTPLGEISAEQFSTRFLINVGGTLFTVRHSRQHRHPRPDRNPRAQRTRLSRTRAATPGRRGGRSPDEPCGQTR